MKLNVQKRLASSIFNCSPKHIHFDPDRLDEIKEAITKADIRRLVLDHAIVKMPIVHTSRVRARKIQRQKSKGLRQGPGSKKGKKTARAPKKRMWINKIRAQRNLLKVLKHKRHISNTAFKNLIVKSKGGFFRSARHIKIYVESNKDTLTAETEKKIKKKITETTESGQKESKKKLKKADILKMSKNEDTSFEN
ncbi:MAG: 50S ribosomal protein L19e [Candidatus Woesearchaeota archaeon]